MASSSSSSSHTRQQSQSQSQAQQQPPSQQSQQQRKRWVEEWEGYTANWSDTERQSILLWQEACTELPTPAKVWFISVLLYIKRHRTNATSTKTVHYCFRCRPWTERNVIRRIATQFITTRRIPTTIINVIYGTEIRRWVGYNQGSDREYAAVLPLVL